jgi:hypothetical protein
MFAKQRIDFGGHLGGGHDVYGLRY